MPQMMPMMWLSMLMSMIMLLFTTMIIIYFFYFPFISHHSILINKYNWTWKW